MTVNIDVLRGIGVRQVLTDLAGSEWKREGAWWKTLCPFHEDTSPSFGVGSRRPDRGRCFVCDATGDVIEIAARLLDVDAGVAIKRLAERYGANGSSTAPRGNGARPAVPARPVSPVPEAPPPVPPVPSYAGALEFLLGRARLEGSAAEYLESRRVLDSARAAGIVGVDTDSNQWLRDAQRAMNTELDEVDSSPIKGLWTLATQSIPFLLLPFTINDRVHAMQARALDYVEGVPRYLTMGRDPGAFGVETLGREGPVVLVEGAIDALSWHEAGYAALGLPGTAWCRWLPRLVEGRDVVLAADDDDAGRRAAGRWGEALAAAGVRVLIAAPYKTSFCGTDANEVLVSGAPEMLRALIRSAKPRGESPTTTMAEAPIGLEISTGSLVEPDPEPSFDGASAGSPAGVTTDDAAGDDRGDDGDGLPFVELGSQLENATPDERDAILKRHALSYVIEALHWRWSKEGDATRLARVQPPHRLTDTVIAWFEGRGGYFLRDATGNAWLYFGRRFMRMQSRAERGNVWAGFLYRTGRINLEDPEGRLIAGALRQYAYARDDCPDVRPWMWADTDELRVAIHLHDDGDHVALASPGRLTRRPNGADKILLRPNDDDDRPTLRLRGRPSTARAAELLDELVRRNLAVSDCDSTLYVCWTLSAFLRQRAKTRGLLFAMGPSGAGKSEAAKLSTTLLYGRERLITPTLAALWVESARQPLVALDNVEHENLGEDLRHYLLLSSSGGTRKKRLEGTAEGILDQKTDALVLVTAIEPPAVDELIQRTMTIRFDRRRHRADYRPAHAVRQLARARHQIVHGWLRLLADQVLPRLARADELAARVKDHPKTRLAAHLGLMALIGETLHTACADRWPLDGDKLLDQWLEAQGGRARQLAVDSDPIVAAMATLLFSMNRAVVMPDGSMRQPAIDDGLYRCEPLYWNKDGDHLTPRLVGAGDWLLTRGGKPAVVGVSGGYDDLHEDLVRAEQQERAGGTYRRRITGAAVLSGRMRSNAAVTDSGWRAKFIARRRQRRVYHWWHAPTIGREGGEDERATLPDGSEGGTRVAR